MGDGEPLLKCVNIWKMFGRVTALKGVDLVVNRREVVGLLGDNGAGKSTLAKIISGVYQPDRGELYFEGRRVVWRSPRESREAGIEMLYQDLALIDVLSVSRNFFLGREPVRRFGPFKFLDFRTMNTQSLESVRKVGINLRSPAVRASALSGGEKQAVAFARSMFFGMKLVILDEPTANLSVRESHRVLELVKDLRDRGLSIIFITHNIYHVYEVADRFVILDRGVKIAEYEKGEVTPEEVIETIRLGRDVKAG